MEIKTKSIKDQAPPARPKDIGDAMACCKQWMRLNATIVDIPLGNGVKYEYIVEFNTVSEHIFKVCTSYANSEYTHSLYLLLYVIDTQLNDIAYTLLSNVGIAIILESDKTWDDFINKLETV